MTKVRKITIYQRENGLCYLCQRPVPFGDCEVEHPNALTTGGPDDDAELRVVHVACHKPKTADDKRKGAKIVRIQKRLDGTRRPRKKIPTAGWPKGSRPIPSRPFPK
jgi:5-methylcytosine-specific restriction endonuclease McrA